MSRTNIKYIKKSHQFKYFADKIKVCHWLEIDSEMINHIEYLIYGGKKIKIFFKKLSNGEVRVLFFSYHNLNRILRNWGKNTLNINRSGSDFAHDDNFIPFNLRKAFSKNKYSHKYQRQEATAIFFRNILLVEKNVIKALMEERYSLFFQINFKRSIHEIELCYDIPSIAPIEFSQDVEIKNKFSQVAKETCLRQYGANGEITIKSVQEEEKLGHPYIAAKLNDGSLLKVYTKETSNTTHLNRIERLFRKRQLKRSVQSIKLTSSKDFLILLKQISDQSFKLIFPLLNTPINFDNSKLNQLIEKFCWANYGKHAQDALKDLTTGGRFIKTGKKGKSTNAVGWKTRKLFKEGGPIRKIGIGKYALDIHKLKSTNI